MTEAELAEEGVSVIIPTKDRCPLLVDAIRCALGQEGVELEVIVVDDGSSDGTGRMLERLGEPRLRTLRNERSVGLGRARNAGLRVARGRWVAFLDDDDLWSPLKLRRQLDAAAREGAIWAYASAVIVDASGDVVYEFPVPPADRVLSELLRINVVPAGGSNVIARRDVLLELSGFDAERFSRFADWDLWLRLAASGPAAALREPLLAYCRHGGTMSGGGRAEALVELERLREKHRSLSAELGVTFDRAGVERWIENENLGARRSRAGEQLAARRRFRAAGTLVAAAVAHRSLGELRRAAAVAVGERARHLVDRLRAAGPVPHPAAREPAWLSPYLEEVRAIASTTGGAWRRNSGPHTGTAGGPPRR